MSTLVAERVAATSLLLLVCACPDTTTLEGDADDAGGDDGAAWTEALGDAGEIGWRDSTTPWSPPVHGSDYECRASAVWSAPDSVYALLRWVRRLSTGAEEGVQVDVNSGSRWEMLFSRPCDPALPGGCPEEMMGGLDEDVLTWPLFLRGGAAGSVLADPHLDRARSAFVVAADLAYALPGWTLPQEVVRFDGTSWEPLPEVLPPVPDLWGIWADESSVVVVGEGGTVLATDGSGWRGIDSGTLATIKTIWGFGTDDLWFATDEAHSRLLHAHRGVAAAVEWGDRGGDDECDDGRITRMWGIGGTVFLVAGRQFVRLRDGEAVALAHWPGEAVPGTSPTQCRGGLRIHDLWGNSDSEVFLAVSEDDTLSAGDPCLGHHLVRWDGTTVHWF